MAEKDKDVAPAPAPVENGGEVGGPRTVAVLDQDGRETIVTHPSALNNLVYGAGYKLKDGKRTVEQAAEYLAGRA